MNATLANQPRCPACGNGQLPEFFQPAGLAFCPSCGGLLQRRGTALRAIGRGSSSLTAYVRRHLKPETPPELLLTKIAEAVVARGEISESEIHQIVQDHGLGSLDTVELIMAIEEELGITVNSK
jgi:acyl carrier protein